MIQREPVKSINMLWTDSQITQHNIYKLLFFDCPSSFFQKLF